MELLISIAVSVLFFVGFFLLLQGSLVRAILGILFLSNAVNLVIFAFSGLIPGGSVFVGETAQPPPYNDPLTQAMILTAIVISFGFTLFFLVLALFAHPLLKGDRIGAEEDNVVSSR